MVSMMFLLCLPVQKHHPEIRTIPAQYKQLVCRGASFKLYLFLFTLISVHKKNNSNHTLNNYIEK